MKIDTEWFTEQILQSKYGSQVQLSKAMTQYLGRTIDQPMLSRMLRGDRKILLEEAVAIADLLGVSLLEISAHAGVEKKRR